MHESEACNGCIDAPARGDQERHFSNTAGRHRPRASRRPRGRSYCQAQAHTLLVVATDHLREQPCTWWSVGGRGAKVWINALLNFAKSSQLHVHTSVCVRTTNREAVPWRVTSNTIVANALLPFLSRQSSGRVVTKLAQSSAHASSCSRK
jgi:hypothetical protein